MDDTPLITVITVCYNAGYDLDKTVASVLGQNYDNYEYIIKDGGSTDHSIERIPDDKRIKVIQKDDHGIFDAMNQSLEIADGQFVNFLNAGDLFFDTEVLNTVAKYHHENPKVDFFYGDHISSESKMEYIRIPKTLSKFFLFTGTVCHQTWFLSRQVQVNYGGYSTQHMTGGDYRMLLDLVLKKDITRKKIDKVLIEYK
jgi:glycosyltransferase involved in cell wall biosynthesis